MAQLGNTGINGNLMVVGKIVANSILTGGGTFTGDVTIAPGHLKTNLIKSADGSQYIAEITNNETPNPEDIGSTPLECANF